MMERFACVPMCMGLALVGGAMAMVTQATQLWHLFLLWSLLLGMAHGPDGAGAVVANRWFAAGLGHRRAHGQCGHGQLAFLLAAWMIEQPGSATVPVFVASALIAGFVNVGPPSTWAWRLGGDASALPPPAMAMNFGTPFKVLPRPRATAPSCCWRAPSSSAACPPTAWCRRTSSRCEGDNGMGAVPAASVLAMMGAFDFVGTVLSGWLSDRYDNRKLLFYYGLRDQAAGWLPHSTAWACSPCSTGWTGSPRCRPRSPTAQHFGPQRVLVFGWIFAAHQLGAAAVAWAQA